MHVDLGGAGDSSELAKVRKDHEVGVSVFLVLQFLVSSSPLAQEKKKKKKHTCTRKMLRLFMFCFWPGASRKGLVTLALLGHYL